MNLNREDGGLMLSTPRRGVQKLVYLYLVLVTPHYPPAHVIAIRLGPGPENGRAWSRTTLVSSSLILET